MKMWQKISSIILVCCILQWPSMQVNSATSTSSNQLSYGQTSGDQSKDGSTRGLLGAIYHKSRQSRCVTCYDDRYDDRSRYYGGYSSRSADDRYGSWYYPRNDRYDDRHRGGDPDYDRYGGDRYGGDRYGGVDRYGGYRDDRYDTRSAYDRYDTRGYRYSEKRGSYDRGESRGYGYDNRDRYYGGDRDGGYAPRDRYYERSRYGSSYGGGGAPGYGYDRDYYDRYSPRYDYRSYRPSWDDMYSKGQSGYSYDNYARGYYTSKAGKEDRRYLPEPGYRYPSSSPCGTLKPNCAYGPQDGGTRVSSGPIDSGNHNAGVSHAIYNPGTNHNDSSKGPGSGWSYMREDDSDRQPPRGSNGSSGGGSNGSNGTGGGGGSSSSGNRDRNRDDQSPAYGALLDRGSNLIAVEPAKTTEDGQESNDKSQSSSASSSTVADNGQQNANGQNS